MHVCSHGPQPPTTARNRARTGRLHAVRASLRASLFALHCNCAQAAGKNLFKENKIINWFVQMSLGLHYMHECRYLPTHSFYY
jgi:hypothetical protein